MSTLAERIRAKAPELGRRAMAEMYHTPFWQERFGAQGREMLERDGESHLSQLIEALIAGEPSVLTGYARRLRPEFVSRGSCSRHIDESFARLGRAIAEEIEDPEPALALLRAARRALLYESGPARELLSCAESLAERVLDALSKRHPSWFSAASSYTSLASFESIQQAERARCKADVLEYISYLADALHAECAESFAAHAAWSQAFLARRKAPEARVEETLAALFDCLPASASSAPAASHAPGPALANGAAPRASWLPAGRRPPLSQPPPPPLPVPVSPELAARARAVLGEALDSLAREAGRSGANAARGAVP